MRQRKVHELKSWVRYYNAKPFEVRRNDRDFAEGDLLFFREWDEVREAYTGRESIAQVGYIYDGEGGGVTDGYIAFVVEELSMLSDEWSDEYTALACLEEETNA